MQALAECAERLSRLISEVEDGGATAAVGEGRTGVSAIWRSARLA